MSSFRSRAACIPRSVDPKHRYTHRSTRRRIASTGAATSTQHAAREHYGSRLTNARAAAPQPGHANPIPVRMIWTPQKIFLWSSAKHIYRGSALHGAPLTPAAVHAARPNRCSWRIAHKPDRSPSIPGLLPAYRVLDAADGLRSHHRRAELPKKNAVFTNLAPVRIARTSKYPLIRGVPGREDPGTFVPGDGDSPYPLSHTSVSFFNGVTC